MSLRIIPRSGNIYPLSFGGMALPVNTVLPLITGNAQNDSILSGSNGIWSGVPLSYTYQWKRDGANIVGATSNTYLVVLADIDHTLTFTVTATNIFGSVNATSLGVAVTNTLLNSLISYWKLDEVSTGVAPVTRNDSVVASANNLTDINNTPSAAGIINNGVNPTIALTQKLQVASNAGLQTGDINFSVACWFKLNSVGLATGQVIVCKSEDVAAVANNEWSITNTSVNNFLTLRVSSGVAVQTLVDTTLIVAGTWNFVVIWHNALTNGLFIQVNNGTITTIAYPNGVALTGANFYVGGDGTGVRYTTGVIDEIGFWKRVISVNERTALFNAGVGLSYPF